MDESWTRLEVYRLFDDTTAIHYCQSFEVLLLSRTELFDANYLMTCQKDVLISLET